MHEVPAGPFSTLFATISQHRGEFYTFSLDVGQPADGRNFATVSFGHATASSLPDVAAALTEALGRVYAARCRNPRDGVQPGKAGCQHDHQWEIPPKMPIAGIVSVLDRLARLLVLMTAEPVRLPIGRHQGPRFRLDLSGPTTGTWSARLKLDGLREAFFWREEQRLSNHAAVTPDAAVDDLIDQLEQRLVDGLVFERLHQQLRQQLEPQLHPDWADKHPYYQWRNDGAWMVVWAVKARNQQGRRFMYAAGRDREEALRNALAGQRLCLKWGRDPCRKPSGHRDACDLVRHQDAVAG